jgi:hypothetical protein
MFLELAKPVALLLSILSLFASFRAAFLIPASELHTRIHDGVVFLLVAAAISILGGLLFREADIPYRGQTSLAATLPVQLFCWATSIMLVLFGVSWFLETFYMADRNSWY